MALFRRNNVPIKFVFFRVYEEELIELKKIITENGGEVVRDNTENPIIFTQSCNYCKLIWPVATKAKIYDVKFIWECVRQSKIVDPAPYRLSPMAMFDECLMSHFLFGGCNCRSHSTAPASADPVEMVELREVPSQLTTTSISTDDFFTPASRLPDMTSDLSNSTENTLDPLASPTSVTRSSNHELASQISRLSPNHMATVNIKIELTSSMDWSRDELNRTSIDESQLVVTRPHILHHAMQLSSGDNKPMEVIDDVEKRPCSVEYNTQVEPKLRMLDRQRQDNSSRRQQQRTPTTLSDAHHTRNNVSLPNDASADPEDVTRSAQSGENDGTNGDFADYSMDFKTDTKEPDYACTSPEKSETSTIIAVNSPRSIADSRKRLHPVTDTRKMPLESSWIVPDSISTHERDDLDAAHSIAKYMKCNDGEKRLLNESQHSISLLPEKRYCSTPKKLSSQVNFKSSKVFNQYNKNYRVKYSIPIKIQPEAMEIFDTSSISDESDSEILISRIPHKNEDKTVVNVFSSKDKNVTKRSKTFYNDEDWNKPGTSGTNGRPRTCTQDDILSSASSEDDESSCSELGKTNENKIYLRSQSECNSKEVVNDKKDSATRMLISDLKILDPSDFESHCSFENEDANSISEKARNKTKANEKSVERDKHRAKKRHRESRVDSSDTDSSTLSSEISNNTKSTAAKNKRTAVPVSTKSTSGNRKTNNSHTAHRQVFDDSSDVNINLAAKKNQKVVELSANGKHTASNGRSERRPVELVELDSDSDDDEYTNSMSASVESTRKSTEQSSDRRKYASRNENRKKNVDLSNSGSDTSSPSHPLHGADIYTKLKRAKEKSEKKRRRPRHLTAPKSKTGEKREEIDLDSDRISVVTFESSDEEVSVAGPRNSKKSRQAPKPKNNKTKSNGHTNHQRDDSDGSEGTSNHTSNGCSIESNLLDPAADRSHIPGHRTWYTHSDRKKIIEYIVDTKSIGMCKGLKLFELMARDKILQHRTPQSLYVEFQKILSDIDKYAKLFKLSPATVKEFKLHLRKT